MSEHNELGKILREARENNNVTIKEASKATKISVSVLEQLERGEYKKLPSYVHATGFLKIYTKFLGLKFDELKDIFEREYRGEFYEEDKARDALSEVIEDVKKNDKQKKYIFATVTILFILIAIVSLLVYLKMSNSTIKKDNINIKKNVILDDESVGSATSEEINANIDNSDNYSVLSPVELVEQLKESESTEKAELKSVTFEFSDTCWVHVNIDGKHELDFIAEAGTNKIIEFLNFFEIDVGNASAIKIKYKDQTFTGLGGWRQPVKNLYFKIDKDGKLIFLKK